MKYKELLYMINDELKNISDDAYFTLDHIRFLCNKYRAKILKMEYDTKAPKPISEANYQTICLTLEPVNNNVPCEDKTLLKSKEEIPPIIKGFGEPMIYPIDFYNDDRIAYISRNRMKYVGYNKWLKNIIYCSLHPDGHLYFTSGNPQFSMLESASITAIFEDADKASDLANRCNGEDCDILEREYPLEDNQVNNLIQLVVRELTAAIYKPEDSENNASDDMSDMMTFIRRNMKNSLQQQIEG
jgi:hypothetical protein|nr:MAG TPA: Structural protein [Crassvirales sp.]